MSVHHVAASPSPQPQTHTRLAETAPKAQEKAPVTHAPSTTHRVDVKA